MLKRLLLTGAAAVTLLAAPACSGSDTPVATGGGGGSSTTGASGAGGSGTTMAAAPGTTEAMGCSTSLKVVNAAAAKVDGLSDGELDLATTWADEGPHPDNTVDYDGTLEGVVSTSEIEKDPQFGYGVPVGIPELDEGELQFAFSLQLDDGKIAGGQTFSDDAEAGADGEINFSSVYFGSERLLLGDMTIAITEFTDDDVCITVGAVTDTDLQTFVGLEGTVKLTRIQSLEAAEGN